MIGLFCFALAVLESPFKPKLRLNGVEMFFMGVAAVGVIALAYATAALMTMPL